MHRLAMLLVAAMAGLPALAQPPAADGEVTRINARTGEITIKHGPIPHLDMGPMRMAFPVKDPAMLKAVKPGDKVRFVAEKVGDEAVITKIEVSR
jgi:Cu(I)/Ag(I) efflux system protein CusF